MRTIRRPGARRQNGIMIIDAIVGMFLISITFSVIIASATTGMQTGRRAREYENAGLAARQVVENIRGFKYANIANGTYSDATTLGSVPQLANLKNGTVSASVTTFDTRSKQVVITVSWLSIPAKQTISQKFVTLFSSDGVAK